MRSWGRVDPWLLASLGSGGGIVSTLLEIGEVTTARGAVVLDVMEHVGPVPKESSEPL